MIFTAPIFLIIMIVCSMTVFYLILKQNDLSHRYILKDDVLYKNNVYKIKRENIFFITIKFIIFSAIVYFCYIGVSVAPEYISKLFPSSVFFECYKNNFGLSECIFFDNKLLKIINTFSLYFFPIIFFIFGSIYHTFKKESSFYVPVLFCVVLAFFCSLIDCFFHNNNNQFFDIIYEAATYITVYSFIVFAISLFFIAIFKTNVKTILSACITFILLQIYIFFSYLFLEIIFYLLGGNLLILLLSFFIIFIPFIIILQILFLPFINCSKDKELKCQK